MPATVSTSDFTGFETQFNRLGEIVSKLDSGNLPLEEMLKLYEEATLLSGRLTGMLEQAELRVQKLAGVHEEDAENELDEDDLEDLENFMLE